MAPRIDLEDDIYLGNSLDQSDARIEKLKAFLKSGGHPLTVPAKQHGGQTMGYSNCPPTTTTTTTTSRDQAPSQRPNYEESSISFRPTSNDPERQIDETEKTVICSQSQMEFLEKSLLEEFHKAMMTTTTSATTTAATTTATTNDAGDRQIRNDVAEKSRNVLYIG